MKETQLPISEKSAYSRCLILHVAPQRVYSQPEASARDSSAEPSTSSPISRQEGENQNPRSKRLAVQSLADASGYERNAQHQRASARNRAANHSQLPISEKSAYSRALLRGASVVG